MILMANVSLVEPAARHDVICSGHTPTLRTVFASLWFKFRCQFRVFLVFSVFYYFLLFCYVFELRLATPFVVSGPIDLLALLFAIRMSWLQSCLSGLSGLELERERSLAVSTARIQVQLRRILDSSRTSNALHNFSAKVHKVIVTPARNSLTC